jgi:hypothetical protein
MPKSEIMFGRRLNLQESQEVRKMLKGLISASRIKFLSTMMSIAVSAKS